MLTMLSFCLHHNIKISKCSAMLLCADVCECSHQESWDICWTAEHGQVQDMSREGLCHLPRLHRYPGPQSQGELLLHLTYY